jgi:acyl carrier protein
MDILTTVKGVITRLWYRGDPARITLQARLIEDLHADSLSKVEMVLDLEEALGIAITDAETERLETIGDVVSLCTRRAKVRA